MDISTNQAPIRTAYQLGQRIARAREAADVTQDDLAIRLGVYRPNLSRIELGKTTIQTQLIFDVLAELGLDIHLTERARP